MPAKPRSATVPRLQAAGLTFAEFAKVYGEHQAVLVKGCLKPIKREPRGRHDSAKPALRKTRFGLSSIRRLYASYPKMVESTFNLESARAEKSSSANSDASPKCVLGKHYGKTQGAWYASFILQKNKRALSAFLKDLPFSEPPFLPSAKVCHSNAAWLFFGTNPLRRPLHGRPEHTDAIAHNGTWHLQLLGSKVWTLRPTAELKKQVPRTLRGAGAVNVRCDVGDVLCINTRLWWHHTHLPASCGSSASVARDIWLDGRASAACDLTNIDGHYAKAPIAKGTVLFTADDAPDLELPRSSSSKANCGLRELPDGTMAVVAKRKIEKGDWVAISDSECEDEPPQRRKRARGS